MTTAQLLHVLVDPYLVGSPYHLELEERIDP